MNSSSSNEISDASQESSSFDALTSSSSSSFASMDKFGSGPLPDSGLIFPLSFSYDNIMKSNQLSLLDAAKNEKFKPTLASSDSLVSHYLTKPLLLHPNNQFWDYQTSIQLLRQHQQQHKNFQLPTGLNSIKSKNALKSPPPPLLFKPGKQMEYSNLTTTSAQNFSISYLNENERDKANLVENSYHNLRQHKVSKNFYATSKPKLNNNLVSTASEIANTNQNLMHVVSAASLIKFYGTKNLQKNSTIIEGNIRKSCIKCVVCEDKQATGRHYGVTCCFGCKSFWYRSVWFNRVYRCKFNCKCPTRRIVRNICRSCRLKKCFMVAVQTHGENDKKFGSKKAEQNSDSSQDASISSISMPKLISSCSNKAIQTKGFFDNVHWSEDAIKEGQTLVKMHQEVCKRMDDPVPLMPELSMFSKISNPLVESLAFSYAFYNPSLIFSKTSLNPVGIRLASIKDILEDWKRCFVLYSDWLLALPEFIQLSKDDQVIVAKHRFTSFHWWICGLWALEAKIDGICYSNGSYFPRNKSEQCIPDLQCVVEKMLTHFFEPLKNIHINSVNGLSDIERCGLFVIALFNNDLPVSTNGREKMRKSQEKFSQIIFNSALLNINKSHGISADNNSFIYEYSEAAEKLSKISMLAGTLNILSTVASPSILPDILHVINCVA